MAVQSSTELFEKPVLVSIIAYKWGAYGRSLLVLLVALSVLLALNLTAYNLTITLRLGIGSRLLWTAYLVSCNRRMPNFSCAKCMLKGLHA